MRSIKEDINMKLVKKAAYLHGLVDGLGIDESTSEGKVLRAMSELLVEMADELQRLDEDIDDVCGDVDLLTEDVEDIQDFLLDEDEEDDEEPEEDDEDPCYEVECPHCGATVYVTEADLEEKEAFCEECGKSFSIELVEDDEADDDEDETVEYEITCPSCGATTVVSEDELDGDDLQCAQCGASLMIDVEEDETEADE
jgi:DNA-directed RNA polymerase subunit RPC12/RpoP